MRAKFESNRSKRNRSAWPNGHRGWSMSGEARASVGLSPCDDVPEGRGARTALAERSAAKRALVTAIGFGNHKTRRAQIPPNGVALPLCNAPTSR